jgi:hypothetical protein
MRMPRDDDDDGYNVGEALSQGKPAAPLHDGNLAVAESSVGRVHFQQPRVPGHGHHDTNHNQSKQCERHTLAPSHGHVERGREVAESVQRHARHEERAVVAVVHLQARDAVREAFLDTAWQSATRQRLK